MNKTISEITNLVKKFFKSSPSLSISNSQSANSNVLSTSPPVSIDMPTTTCTATTTTSTTSSGQSYFEVTDRPSCSTVILPPSSLSCIALSDSNVDNENDYFSQVDANNNNSRTQKNNTFNDLPDDSSSVVLDPPNHPFVSSNRSSPLLDFNSGCYDSSFFSKSSSLNAHIQ